MIQPLNSLLQDKGVSRSESFSSEKQTVLNADLDRSLRYFVVFIILGGGVAAWFSYVLMLLRTVPTTLALINVGIVATIFLLVMIFQSVLIRSARFNFYIVLIEAVLMPVFSYGAFSPWYAVATVAFIAVWWFGYSRAQVMISAVLKVNFWQYSLILVSVSISALAIFFACFNVGLYERSGGLSFNAYKLVTSTVGLEYAVPNFEPDARVDSFFEGLVRSKIDGLPEFQRMAPADQGVAVKEAAIAVRNNVTAFTKLSAQPDETLLQYTYRVVSNFLRSAREQGHGFLVISGLLVSIFLAIKGVMFFIKWPVVLLAFIIYILLQAIGIISIGAEMRQKEVIVVK